MFEYGIPFEIASIADSSQNVNSGLCVGDRIIGINGEDATMLLDIKDKLQKFKGDTINVTVEKYNGDLLESICSIPLLVDTTGALQVGVKTKLGDFYHVTKKSYSLLSAVPAGFNKAVSTVGNYWKELKLIFSPKTEAYKSVGSFIAIGKIFPDQWNWRVFWNITAFLSIMLAVLNILPIPALDGGHIMFTLYEIITRRKPSDKFMEYAQTVGMIFLFALMILAFGNDIFRLFN